MLEKRLMQLTHIETRLANIDLDMKDTEKRLTRMVKCCNPSAMSSNQRKKIKDTNENKWKANTEYKPCRKTSNGFQSECPWSCNEDEYVNISSWQWR